MSVLEPLHAWVPHTSFQLHRSSLRCSRLPYCVTPVVHQALLIPSCFLPPYTRLVVAKHYSLYHSSKFHCTQNLLHSRGHTPPFLFPKSNLFHIISVLYHFFTTIIPRPYKQPTSHPAFAYLSSHHPIILTQYYPPTSKTLPNETSTPFIALGTQPSPLLSLLSRLKPRRTSPFPHSSEPQTSIHKISTVSTGSQQHLCTPMPSPFT